MQKGDVRAERDSLITPKSVPQAPVLSMVAQKRVPRQHVVPPLHHSGLTTPNMGENTYRNLCCTNAPFCSLCSSLQQGYQKPEQLGQPTPRFWGQCRACTAPSYLQPTHSGPSLLRTPLPSSQAMYSAQIKDKDPLRGMVQFRALLYLVWKDMGWVLWGRPRGRGHSEGMKRPFQGLGEGWKTENGLQPRSFKGVIQGSHKIESYVREVITPKNTGLLYLW